MRPPLTPRRGQAQGQPSWTFLPAGNAPVGPTAEDVGSERSTAESQSLGQKPSQARRTFCKQDASAASWEGPSEARPAVSSADTHSPHVPFAPLSSSARSGVETGPATSWLEWSEATPGHGRRRLPNSRSASPLRGQSPEATGPLTSKSPSFPAGPSSLTHTVHPPARLLPAALETTERKRMLTAPGH